MIGSLAFKFLGTPFGRTIIFALALLSALFANNRYQRKQGGKDAVDNQVNYVRDRTEKGKDAYNESRRANSGRDIDALIDSMRGNDRHWGRLPDLR